MPHDLPSPLRVCLLTDQDLSKPLPEGDWPCDPRPYLPEAEWTLGVLEPGKAVRQVLDLAATHDVDVWFNLCDAAFGESRPGREVIEALEHLDAAFTGADSTFYEPSREAMKRVCAAWDIDTPAYALLRDEGEVERALDTLRFPMIVKHPSSYASVDLTPESRVTDARGLRERVRFMLDKHHGALVEEFVEGGEATVLVAETPDDAGRPTTWPPVEYRFPEGETFKHYHLKWSDYHGLVAEPVEDPVLEAALRRASADFFVGLRGAGYGRCDLRIDRDGRPWMLEINPNPGMFYPPGDPGSADLILMQEEGGHAAFTRQVVRAALARRRRRCRGWEVLSTPDLGYGIVATRSFRPGETILPFEETPHRLVTLGRVEATWGERERAWFDRYAWPLTDEVWVMWSDDPMEWKPVNHSCDPSAWVEGLDVVARRPLEPGDEVTLDYGSVHNERMPSFECRCGAARCRGVIRGSDLLSDAVGRYGRHVTDYVRRRRARAEG